MKPVGQNLPHESAKLHVTGTAKYSGDLEMLGLLVAHPVQAIHARARVLKLSLAAALEVPGVVTVLTQADIPGENNTGAVKHDEPLLSNEVMYHGQAIAWVVAENDGAARAAAAKVNVEYEVLEPILGIKNAIKANSFHTDALKIRRGDPEAALEKNLTLEGEIEVGGQDHFYLETQASLAFLDEDGGMTVHSSTQHPSETQAIVAHVLGWARHRVSVQSLRMGGGFGGKESQANPYAAVAALAALKTKRPVRVRLSRHVDMQLTGKRHPMLGKYRAGFDKAGNIQALKLEIYADAGWSLDLSEAIVSRAMFHCDNAYFIPNLEVTGFTCKTNVTSHTAFRGFGGPQGMVMIEEILDRVARAVQRRPEVVRELNFYNQFTLETRTTHYGQTISDLRIQGIWQALKTSSDFESRQLEIELFNATHPFLKRGLAITPVKFGISFTTTFLNQAGALVLIYQDGSVQVNHGGTEMGQGLHTKISQIAAQTLGIHLEQIRVMPTRTDKVPNTSATAASSGTDLNGAAVKNACEILRDRLSQVAAGMLNCHPEDVRFENARVHAIGKPESNLEFEKVITAAYLARVSLSSTGFFRTPEIHYDKIAGRGEPFRYFAWGAAVSEVEVDSLTGMWHLRRADILHDCGDSLNPLVDRGQVEGGFVQGMGWLTMEELVWDDTGKLRTFAPSTYKIPTLADIPLEFHVDLLPRATEPNAVFGSKAVGEPPLMLAISVREALRDAISSFGDTEVSLGAPSTPEAILDAIERVKESRAETVIS
jgi:xanthine dehydrogenase large subunit